MAEVAEKKRRTSSRSTAKKKVYVTALRKHGTVFHAAKAAGVHRSTIYHWREADSEFVKAEKAAYEDCVEVMEDSMYKRGLAGDNTAMIFWLKGAKPEKYKDRVHQEITGKGGGPIEVRTSERIIELRDDFASRIKSGEYGGRVPSNGSGK